MSGVVVIFLQSCLVFTFWALGTIDHLFIFAVTSRKHRALLVSLCQQLWKVNGEYSLPVLLTLGFIVYQSLFSFCSNSLKNYCLLNSVILKSCHKFFVGRDIYIFINSYIYRFLYHRFIVAWMVTWFPKSQQIWSWELEGDEWLLKKGQ